MKISFVKRLKFYNEGKTLAKRKGGVEFSWFCPYTKNSQAADWFWRGFHGKKAPVNPLIYAVQ